MKHIKEILPGVIKNIHAQAVQNLKSEDLRLSGGAALNEARNLLPTACAVCGETLDEKIVISPGHRFILFKFCTAATVDQCTGLDNYNAIIEPTPF